MNGGHHHRDVHARGEGVERDRVRVPLGADVLAHLVVIEVQSDVGELRIELISGEYRTSIELCIELVSGEYRTSMAGNVKNGGENTNLVNIVRALALDGFGTKNKS